MDSWNCRFTVNTTGPDGRHHRLEFYFDGLGDVEGRALAAFEKRSRKPWLYRGEEAHVLTPLGQTCRVLIPWS